MLLAAVSGGLSEQPPPVITDPATMTVPRHVATGGSWWRGSSVANGSRGTTAVTRHVITAPARALRMRRGTGQTTTLTGKAGLVVRGVLHRVTWAGADTLTLSPPAFADSDPLDVQVEAGEVVYAVWEAPPGGAYASGFHADDNQVARVTSGKFSGVSPLNSDVLALGPIVIRGLTQPDVESIGCFGDSILESGWMRRAAATTGKAWADLSQWAEAVPAAPPLFGRMAPSDPQGMFTLALSEYGTNNRGGSPAAGKVALLAWWTWLSGIADRVGQTTLTPWTSGTFTTLDGQTAVDVAYRDAINAWLRDGAPITGGAPADVGTEALRVGETGHPLVGICDIAAAAETLNSRGERVWKVAGGQPTLDGVHPTRVGADLLQPAAETWFARYLA